MLSELGRRPMIGASDGSYGEEFDNEIGMLLREQRRQEADDRERELNLFRSGSAPPTVEGALSAVGGLLSGSTPSGNADFPEELRSDPAYHSYYYSNVNLNPRLPPPLLSREDWRYTQRLNGGNPVVGGIGDRRKVSRADSGSGRSLFSMPPGFESRKQETDVESEKIHGSDWGGDGLIGLPGLGLGSKQKSIAELIQDDLTRAPPVSGPPSRSCSRNAFNEAVDNIPTTETNSYTYAAALGASLSRSTTPDPQSVARAPSPCPTPIGQGRGNASDKRSINTSNSFNGVSSPMRDTTELVAALSGIDLSSKVVADDDRNLPLFGQNQVNKAMFMNNSDNSVNFQGRTFPAGNNFAKVSPNSNQFQNLENLNSGLPNYGYNVSPTNQLGSLNLPPLFENAAAASAMGFDTRVLGGGIGSSSNLKSPSPESHNMGRMGNSYVDPMYLQYSDPALDRNYVGNSYMNLLELQKAYLGSLLSPQKTQYGKSLSSNHLGYYPSHPSFGVGMTYPSSSPGSPLRHNDLNSRYPSGMRNSPGNLMGLWQLDGNMNETFASSLLEEFKSNKTKCLELAEIAGHVVEFSADQYGSRFIQQKLETATTDEKNMVYQEIMPQALALMTDVFGNYVIQKFFEHGLPLQRRELAGKLYGHVLTLSLQMYGCRVIQKAIEVVDLDQKIKMVEELDGHVMRCVRDQNGNHVIQKCIECVPENNIQFIVTTFVDQVVSLSMHPYGCRVIQRILEHCKDLKTQSKVMDEILGAVSVLAQDQYGNYVVQHVLEHGKAHERSAIIKELAGQIVQMSQQKFASNVVEKCLAFGGPNERQLLVSEMLGTTDENEPLQAMMKDQFANYVVQKVLETCDDHQRELILSRIKVHLNALKKYTYGKHIVARVEKLVAAGERRIAAQSLLNG